MTHIRRFIALLLLASSGLAAMLGWQAYAVASPPAASSSPAVLPVLSPRRVPDVAGELTQEALLRDAANKLVASLPPGSVCIDVERNGRPVVSTNAVASMVPASTHKLLTATAALNILGGDHKFKTTVAVSEKVREGVVDGPLYLEGGGDPLLLTKNYVDGWGGRRSMHTSLETLADQVASAGIKDVRYGIVADESRFDSERYLNSWDSGFRTGGQVGPIGALSVNQGFGLGSGRVAVTDLAVSSASVFADLLRDRGVTIAGGASKGEVPSSASTVASIDSLPVSQLVQEMLTESDNTTAETLLKNIGYEVSKKGTFADGARAITDDLREQGFPLDGVVVSDGSGLDRNDRVTCDLLTKLLVKGGPALSGALPRAGQTGTLTDRFGGTPAVGRLVAKTGTLAGVSGLAGWASPEGQASFDFAIVTNGIASGVSRSAEDQLALLLVNQPKGQGSAVFAPEGITK